MAIRGQGRLATFEAEVGDYLGHAEAYLICAHRVTHGKRRGELCGCTLLAHRVLDNGCALSDESRVFRLASIQHARPLKNGMMYSMYEWRERTGCYVDAASGEPLKFSAWKELPPERQEVLEAAECPECQKLHIFSFAEIEKLLRNAVRQG